MPLISPLLIVIGGLTLLAILIVQLLIGYRKIKFPGRTHLKVHRYVAWGMLGLALLHGLGALALVGYIPGL